ncbi:serine protease gd-like [Bactrocera neohumeralis]|uniref:serine protease gd-like n=1 Tax=Bactrocera neohumeralis TaxID=98809 RepID=UPI002165196C|nr:serine protease gd-like [Bactrocera neohumeralis]
MLHTVLRCSAFVLFLLHLWRLPITANAQEIPSIACPNYFQYLNYGNGYIGRITLPLSMSSTRLDVRFSQRYPVQSNYYGRLSLFESQQTTLNNLARGLPISYRVDFPFTNVVPKLTRITVNGVTVCAASEYPPPSTALDLQHTLQTATVRGTSPLNSNFDPGFRTDANSIPTQIVNRFPQQTQQIIGQQPQVTRQRPAPNNPFLQPSTRRTPAPADNTCGVEGISATPFIHGGIQISRGQFPWLTAIYQKLSSSGLRFLCGGSLVSANTVITAGHCFKLKSLSASQIVVYLGRHNLDNYGEAGAVSRDIRNLIIHPDYNGNSLPDADIAILHMQSSVAFSQFIRPICLWSEAADTSFVVGQTAYVAGWGADERGHEVSALPKMVDTSIVSDNDCLRSSEVFTRITTPRTICAGNRDGTGPCMGDSGGGLMLNRNGAWMLRGIVSAGLTTQGQCDLSQYVIYCDLAKHFSWVRSNIL